LALGSWLLALGSWLLKIVAVIEIVLQLFSIFALSLFFLPFFAPLRLRVSLPLPFPLSVLGVLVALC
jgi:hypothetical protein